MVIIIIWDQKYSSLSRKSIEIESRLVVSSGAETEENGEDNEYEDFFWR